MTFSEEIWRQVTHILEGHKNGDMDLAMAQSLAGELMGSVVAAALPKTSAGKEIASAMVGIQPGLTQLISDLEKRDVLKEQWILLREAALRFAMDGYELEEAAKRAHKLMDLTFYPEEAKK